MAFLTTQQIIQEQYYWQNGIYKYNTCLGSPFLPPIVVDMMWPVRESSPLVTEEDISW